MRDDGAVGIDGQARTERTALVGCPDDEPVSCRIAALTGVRKLYPQLIDRTAIAINLRPIERPR